MIELLNGGAQPTPVIDLPGVVQLLVGVALSSVVVASLITAVVNLVINRGNRKLAERKDVREGESEQIGRYRAMSDAATVLAEQARKSAETAVGVIQHSLESTQTLVVNLQATVNSQNETIRQLAAVANVQSDALQRMTDDRDRTQLALTQAQGLLTEQERRRDELQLQRDALADTGPTPIINPRRARA